jgi:peptide chain release factor 1
MKAILEIRAGEGGEDSRLFIHNMLRMYSKYCQRKNIQIELVDSSDSVFVCELDGEVNSLLKYEGGVHRVQRVPPTEHNGRRHSSAIAVNILPVEECQFEIKESDIEITAYRSSGPGGQHKNKTETAIRAMHKPTRIVACCANGRSQWSNKQSAMQILMARLNQHFQSTHQENEREMKNQQVGNAGRGEKIRTYNFIENRVKDERASKALYCLDKVMDGDLDRLYILMNGKK